MTFQAKKVVAQNNDNVSKILRRFLFFKYYIFVSSFSWFYYSYRVGARPVVLYYAIPCEFGNLTKICGVVYLLFFFFLFIGRN